MVFLLNFLPGYVYLRGMLCMYPLPERGGAESGRSGELAGLSLKSLESDTAPIITNCIHHASDKERDRSTTSMTVSTSYLL